MVVSTRNSGANHSMTLIFSSCNRICIEAPHPSHEKGGEGGHTLRCHEEDNMLRLPLFSPPNGHHKLTKWARKKSSESLLASKNLPLENTWASTVPTCVLPGVERGVPGGQLHIGLLSNRLKTVPSCYVGSGRQEGRQNFRATG
mmetsp:Transcript_16526/g.29422  ORF Transcript_16526/g.29422 Transcript_16526/m.29422 type:complete len:144 (+) Transcript_16526:2043-2474(+)